MGNPKSSFRPRGRDSHGKVALNPLVHRMRCRVRAFRCSTIKGNQGWPVSWFCFWELDIMSVKKIVNVTLMAQG